ncbi:hypothetical protein SAMN05421768_11523 [Chryseobacterium joostei]|uniref:Natural product n=1 Tax=Chryseobacterium joostei TaxID=112234 RepID=A0A1N7KLT4_9FLAO|nr:MULTISPECIES: class I lanthipeptide [Chryseobacterium]SIS62579.1 hypothetical protein SAMN05421768_11523 [Chryseobacterium joostei]HCM34187.1 hypothetical protein [Chryseobacterium sp.]
MSKRSVKLGKNITLNKDAITRLQEDQLNKLKGGIKGSGDSLDLSPTIDTDSISCIGNTCNRC